jgi:hypothetical protein
MRTKEYLPRLLWPILLLSLCSGMIACLSTTPTVTSTIAAMPSATASAATMPAQPATTISSTSTPTASRALSRTALSRSSPSTGTPIPTTRPTATATPTSPPSCGRSIVFERKQQRTHSLAMVDACSQETVLLTDDEGHDEWPRWSPNGKYIAFLSSRATNLGDEYRDVWLLNIATHEISQLTFDTKIWPFSMAFIWSPNGDEILYSTVDENGLDSIPQIVNLKNGVIRLLPGCFRDPFSWSPDGTKIALEMCLELKDEPPEGHEGYMMFPGNLVVIQPDGKLIAGRTDVDGYRLANSSGWLWSPDNQQIAVAFFSSLAGDGGDLEMVVVEEDRLITHARLRSLIPSLEHKDVKSLAWSPKGEEIAFVVVEPPVRDRPYWGQVHVVDRDFSHFRTLTPEDMFCDGVQWSPDGSQLTFACDDGEPYASIWLVNADGSNLHAITEPAKDARNPQWQPVLHP